MAQLHDLTAGLGPGVCRLRGLQANHLVQRRRSPTASSSSDGSQRELAEDIALQLAGGNQAELVAGSPNAAVVATRGARLVRALSMSEEPRAATHTIIQAHAACV